MGMQKIEIVEIEGKNQNPIENGTSHGHSMGFIYVKVAFYAILLHLCTSKVLI